MRLLDDGHPVLLEAYLDGPEVSLFCLVDGPTVVPLLPAQDFKRVGDDDTGPNTGGMGAYAPLPWAPPGLVDEIVTRVVAPVAAELVARGTPFSGLLYAGLALTSTRHAGRRVQLPVRRPRDPGRPPAAADAAGRAPARGRDRNAGAAAAAGVERRRRGHGGRRRRQLPGHPAAGRRRDGRGGRGRAARGHPPPRRRRGGLRGRPGAVGRGHGPGPRRRAGRRVPAAGGHPARSARTTAPTSRCARSRGRSPRRGSMIATSGVKAAPARLSHRERRSAADARS